MNNSSFPLSLLVTVLALIAVLALAWFTLRFLSGLNRGRLKGGRIQILQTMPVGNRERLVLARVDEQDYLLGVTAGGISLVDKVDVAVAEKSRTAPLR